jgi:hypothetical protein
MIPPPMKEGAMKFNFKFTALEKKEDFFYAFHFLKETDHEFESSCKKKPLYWIHYVVSVPVLVEIV